MRYINLPHEKKAKLARKHKTSRVTVWSALRYQTNSSLAKLIRRDALEMGGVVMDTLSAPAGFLPNCKTLFERDENNRVKKITQVFANGITVILDMKAKTAEILQKEKVVMRVDDPKLEQWTDITYSAQNLSDELAVQA